ncbi:hypothetical protein CSAL01_02835 [Colletotrichum salicis]|uniref:Uncharacterized protein n=1 Tax=Colletotrichum salicis TaxID=1209931 RepID=A0A135SI91_9PEZI|nr:hypothetical protein CSAL01_02835 [Colletotrichum salicis]
MERFIPRKDSSGIDEALKAYFDPVHYPPRRPDFCKTPSSAESPAGVYCRIESHTNMGRGGVQLFGPKMQVADVTIENLCQQQGSADQSPDRDRNFSGAWSIYQEESAY